MVWHPAAPEMPHAIWRDARLGLNPRRLLETELITPIFAQTQPPVKVKVLANLPQVPHLALCGGKPAPERGWKAGTDGTFPQCLLSASRTVQGKLPYAARSVALGQFAGRRVGIA